MQQANDPQLTTNDSNRSGKPGWYRMYSSALLERDRNRALPQIERAQKAIYHRQMELGEAAAINPRELRDLSKASAYLGIMLRNVGTESERLLWD